MKPGQSTQQYEAAHAPMQPHWQPQHCPGAQQQEQEEEQQQQQQGPAAVYINAGLEQSSEHQARPFAQPAGQRACEQENASPAGGAQAAGAPMLHACCVSAPASAWMLLTVQVMAVDRCAGILTEAACPKCLFADNARDVQRQAWLP